MPRTKRKSVGQNPVEVGLYTPWDAARYLHVPFWAVFALSDRWSGWPESKWFFINFHRGFPPYPPWFGDDLLLPSEFVDRNRISFRHFADLFVRAATFHLLDGRSYPVEKGRNHWENLCRAVYRGLEDTSRKSDPFDHTRSIDERLDDLVEPYGQQLEEEQRILLRKWFALRLDRVDVKDGMPVRIYPFSRNPVENSPRTIALDPNIRFGRPTIVGRGVPTDILFERHQAGDSVVELSEDYDITPAEVEEAIRYEATPPALLFPF